MEKTVQVEMAHGTEVKSGVSPPKRYKKKPYRWNR